MKSIAIKPLDLENIEAVVPLFDAQLREHDLLTPVDSLREVARRVISDPLNGFMLHAVAAGDRSVGVAYVASHLTVEHGGIIGWLEELYVAPDWRGEGVGSRLLTALMTHAQQLGWKGVQLEVVEGHERVVPLYRRHGFEPLPRRLFTRLFAPSENG